MAHARKNVFDSHIYNIEYKDEELVHDIIQNGHVFFNEKDERILDESMEEQAEALSRVSSIDLPLSQKSVGKLNSYENTANLMVLLQRELNGERVRGVVSKGLKGYEGWPERKIDDPEVHRYIQNVFEHSVEYLESYLEIDIPKNLKKQIKEFHKGVGGILKFLSLSHANRENKRYGAMVCALSSVAETIHYTWSKPDELKYLESKTRDFSDYLANESNTNVESGEDWELNLKKKGFDIVSFPGGCFKLQDVAFDTKKEHRIWSKLLRIAEKDRSDIVKDGIRTRICVGSHEKGEAIKWLRSLGFHKKRTTNTTRAKEWEAISYMTGNFQGSAVEIQVTDEDMLKRADWGVLRHEVYEEIQKILILCRLFGSVNPLKVKEKKEELVQKYGVDEDALEERMNQFFFKNRDNQRYYSYEYEFRMRGKNIYKEDRFDGVIESFLNDFRKNDRWESLRDLSYNDMKFIFETNTFPEFLDERDSGLFCEFLSEKKGVPSIILQQLEKTIHKAKEMVSAQEMVLDLFEKSDLHLVKDAQIIKEEVVKLMIDIGDVNDCVREYIILFTNEWKKRKDTWEEYEKNGRNVFVKADLFWNLFWKEQEAYIQEFIPDAGMQERLLVLLKPIVNDYVDKKSKTKEI